MESKPYTGKVSGMKTSPWLASEDLFGLCPIKVKIAGVFRNDNVTMDGGRIEKRLFSVSFEGIGKQMILNAGNRKILSSLFGADTKKWVGGEVELTVLEGVKFGNKITTGLRFTAGKSGKARDLNAEMGLTDESPPAVQAKKPTASTPPPTADAEEVEFEIEE
jgi:hypothetical protein